MTRKECNAKLIEAISKANDASDDIRFYQLLENLGIYPNKAIDTERAERDLFYEESEATLSNLKLTEAEHKELKSSPADKQLFEFIATAVAMFGIYGIAAFIPLICKALNIGCTQWTWLHILLPFTIPAIAVCGISAVLLIAAIIYYMLSAR